jgi:hypothetical protein
MRINNRLEIRLTASDLKQALVDYLVKQDNEDIAEFMKSSKWGLDYLYRSKEWSLLIDGIYDKRDNQDDSAE